MGEVLVKSPQSFLSLGRKGGLIGEMAVLSFPSLGLTWQLSVVT